jgi:hypothetical protein
MYVALRSYQHMLEGIDFVIKTDYKPLIYIQKEIPDKANPRSLRQHNFISQFSKQIAHLSASENSVPGALSILCQINIPAELETEEIQGKQKNCSEMKDLLDECNTLLTQEKLSPDATT